MVDLYKGVICLGRIKKNFQQEVLPEKILRAHRLPEKKSCTCKTREATGKSRLSFPCKNPNLFLAFDVFVP